MCTATTAENGSLFEIDKEIEAAFEAASEEQERTGTLSEQTGQHCMDLLGELGKKVDRIAGYVRVMELNAPAAEEEATRLASDVRARFEDRILPVNDAVAE